MSSNELCAGNKDCPVTADNKNADKQTAVIGRHVRSPQRHTSIPSSRKKSPKSGTVGERRVSRPTIALDDPADETRVDGLPVSLLLDEHQDGVGHLFVQRLEETVSPGDQGQLHAKHTQTEETKKQRRRNDAHTGKTLRLDANTKFPRPKTPYKQDTQKSHWVVNEVNTPAFHHQLTHRQDND